MKEMNEMMICPECGAEIEVVDKSMVRCRECGTVLFGTEIEKALEGAEQEIWKCEKCGSVLNEQKDFDPTLDGWKCTECEWINILYEDEYEDEEYFEEAYENMMGGIYMYLDEIGMEYEEDEFSEAITFRYDTKSFAGEVEVEVFPEMDCFDMRTKIEPVAEERNMAKVAEYLHRINDIITTGCFILNYDTGEIYLKDRIYVEPFEEDVDLIFEKSLINSIITVDSYSEDIAKVLLGVVEPKEAIDAMMEAITEKLEMLLEEEMEWEAEEPRQ